MLVAAFGQYFFGITIFVTSLFLILLVLVQRGRGGGLTGALGGPGGQSAFGTKAGDLFTRITVGVAAVWIFLCAAAVFFLKDRDLPDTGVMGRRPATMESNAVEGNDVLSPAAPLDSAVPGAMDSGTSPSPIAPAGAEAASGGDDASEVGANDAVNAEVADPTELDDPAPAADTTQTQLPEN